MPVRTFVRRDLRLHISPDENGAVVVRFSWENTQLTHKGPNLATFVVSTPSQADDAIQWLFAGFDLVGTLGKWWAAPGGYPNAPDEVAVQRVALRIDDAAMAAWPWERQLQKILPPGAGPVVIVRVTPVRPRVAQVPFTVPMRLLEIDPDRFDLIACIGRIFSSFDVTAIAKTVRSETGSIGEFVDHAAPADWPTVDIMHLGAAAMLPRGNAPLQTEDPSALGTLGWLMRATEAWQTRIVVMEAATSDDEIRLRSLAAALCARGGPAVLVGPSDAQGSGFYDAFYYSLIHDNPSDEAVRSGLGYFAGPSLFVGSGREELIRVSGPGQKLHDVAEALRSADSEQRARAQNELGWDSFIIRGPSESPTAPSVRSRGLAEGLENLRTNWRNLSFALSESGGLVPSATQIDDIRRTALSRVGSGARRSQLRPTAPAEPRFANPALWRVNRTGRTERLEPKAAHIEAHQSLILGIQIGPRDSFVPVLEAQALLEEPFKWQRGDEGHWLNIGLSGIDFDVSGHPVQQVWLPRTGATDVVEFTISPRQSGALMLRFCLYFGRSLLQSYRLAAWVGQDPPDPADIARKLAAIIGATEDKVAGARYLGRLEYAATEDLVETHSDDETMLSIFANDVEGRRIITVWTGEELAVSSDANISVIGQEIRRILDDVSGGKYTDGERFYGYDGGPNGNAGDPEEFKAALLKLAVEGQRQYYSILTKQQRKNLEKGPDKPDGIIHVGQALLESVIPWAATYDRRYDAGKTKVDGLDASHVTCTAGLDATAGGLPPACGEHPDCPLSPARLAEQRATGKLADWETVVCPRHFWGFRYRIELPPMQVAPGQAVPRRQPKIKAAEPASIVIGFNGALKGATLHMQELATDLSRRVVKAAISAQSSNRDALMKSLESPDIDLLYFFCHARGGQADPSFLAPQLEFQEDKNAPKGMITWDQLDEFDWGHAPLVFFNGCNTAVFSPDALSPFIRTVVASCGAAGAVGTEIPVFEQLATTFARSFLSRFLDGTAAGQALLDTRLEFLMRHNPLGLAYTLYAFSNLAIAQGSRDGV